jgi:hypothetical protein
MSAASTQSPSPALHEVRLIGLPVGLHARSQEHTAELLREMYLLSQGLSDRGLGERHLPTRLVELVEALTSQFSAFTEAQDREIADAVATGLEEVDIVYSVPVEAGPAASALADMLDEADEFCRQGKHLLTLATPPELVLYRQWVLTEFANQLSGHAATPWPAYAAR